MSGLRCDACHARTTVVDVRMRATGELRRRRMCVKCGQRFTTYEVKADMYDEVRKIETLADQVTERTAALVSKMTRIR